MSPRRAVAWLGCIAYVAAWFLPVIRPGSIVSAIPGWEAFWTALAALWHPKEQSLAETILSGSSALTNAVMAVALVATVRRTDLPPRWAWSLVGAGILNGWWLVHFASDVASIGIGYYLWWLSFLIVGSSLLSRPSRAT